MRRRRRLGKGFLGAPSGSESLLRVTFTCWGRARKAVGPSPAGRDSIPLPPSIPTVPSRPAPVYRLRHRWTRHVSIGFSIRVVPPPKLRLGSTRSSLFLHSAEKFPMEILLWLVPKVLALLSFLSLLLRS